MKLLNRKSLNYFKIVSISTTSLWLLIFSFLPISLIIFNSLFEPSVDHGLTFSLANYIELFNPTTMNVFFRSISLAGLCTLICLLLAYPFSYSLTMIKPRFRAILLLLVIIPFWTSTLIRSYAIMAIIKTKGLINLLLLAFGIIHAPYPLLFTQTAVLIGLVYNLLPFMILPLYSSFERLDKTLVEAAHDLGANHSVTLTQVIIPSTRTGIIAGSILVFFPAMTLFFIPDILGGGKSLLLGNLIQEQFMSAHNWSKGSALSLLLIICMSTLIYTYMRKKDRQDII